MKITEYAVKRRVATLAIATAMIVLGVYGYISLPDDIDPPNVFKADPTQLPVLRLAIGSDNMDMVELRAWAEDYLQDEILAVRGVAGTEVEGGLQREIRVVIDPESLSKHNLSVSDILARLREENVDQFAGRIYEGRRELIARAKELTPLTVRNICRCI